MRGGGRRGLCELSVCLGALSRLISVRFGVDQVYAACVIVCKGNDELRWQYRSIAETWLCLLRSDLIFAVATLHVPRAVQSKNAALHAPN